MQAANEMAVMTSEGAGRGGRVSAPVYFSMELGALLGPQYLQSTAMCCYAKTLLHNMQLIQSANLAHRDKSCIFLG